MPEIVIILMVLVAVVVLSVLGGMLSSRDARKRRADLRRLAGLLGLEFSPSKTSNIPQRFQFLNRLAQGSDRYAFNMLSGRFEGRRVLIFDYHYSVSGGKGTHHQYMSFFILSLERSFPELIIEPEELVSKLTQAMGFADIAFESHEFSRKFHVHSRDKKFAYDFCNARLIEYLLQNPNLRLEVEGSALALAFDDCLMPHAIPVNLQRLVRIRALMPSYLFTE